MSAVSSVFDQCYGTRLTTVALGTNVQNIRLILKTYNTNEHMFILMSSYGTIQDDQTKRDGKMT